MLSIGEFSTQSATNHVLLAQLVFTQQSYCHGVGVHPPSRKPLHGFRAKILSDNTCPPYSQITFFFFFKIFSFRVFFTILFSFFVNMGP